MTYNVKDEEQESCVLERQGQARLVVASHILAAASGRCLMSRLDGLRRKVYMPGWLTRGKKAFKDLRLESGAETLERHALS